MDTRSLLNSLAENLTDITKLSEHTNLSLTEMDELLSREGRAMLAAHSRVCRWQMKLIARRYLPYALTRMIQLADLQDKRPDIVLKACERILAATGLQPAKRPAPRKPEATHPRPDPAAITELLATLSGSDDTS